MTCTAVDHREELCKFWHHLWRAATLSFVSLQSVMISVYGYSSGFIGCHFHPECPVLGGLSLFYVIKNNFY